LNRVVQVSESFCKGFPGLTLSNENSHQNTGFPSKGFLPGL
jgi:hypothetical protein